MFSSKNVIWLSVASVIVVLLAACTTAEPEVRTERVEVTVEVPGDTVEVEVEVPAEVIKIRIAYPSITDFGDIPSLMAHEILADQGYAVLPTFFAGPDLAVEAVARGDAEIGHGAFRTYWAGIAAGAPVISVMDQVANDRLIYGIPEITTCEELEGHSLVPGSNEGSLSFAMASVYLEENCPGTEPVIFFIPGSQNRAAALLAGEIDATVLESSDAIEIDREAPGEFTVLANFAESIPELAATGTHVNVAFAEEHPEAVRDYIRALLTVHRQIKEDPSIVVDMALQRLEIDDEDALLEIVDAYQAADMWRANGGLSEEAIEFSLNFYVNAEAVPAGLSAGDVADLSYLEAVLQEIGSE